MREQIVGGRLPVIALTASPMDRERCLEAAMDGYVAKPIRGAELMEAISQAAPAEPPEPAVIDEHALP